MGLLTKKANIAYYHWRRSNWVFDPGRFLGRYNNVEIDRPIFFVGNQGGGLTLVSRMIRRHPAVVSVSGDHTYWSGADEMQRVMVMRLPETLRLAGRIVGTDPPHPQFVPPRSWSYASDELVDAYHMTEEHYDSRAADRLKEIIREAVGRHGRGEAGKRFVDKSQVFTLKIRYVNALLAGTNPLFVLITRNPYAACYRAAKGKAGDMRRYAKHIDLDTRVDICAQHWSNAIGRALQDGEEVDSFHVMRFEDFLARPAESLAELCSFLGLPYLDDLVPSAHHTIPFGSRFEGRWYPLNPDVNQSYLREIPERHLEAIHRRCGALAEKLRYEAPERIPTTIAQ